jgi:DNA-binding MarR family transcriptional regulator
MCVCLSIITLTSTAENELILSRWEAQILRCIKSKAMTEKRIAKEVTLDIALVSHLITDLMLRGYVQRVRKRRMYFSSREYFSATLDGLTALEASRRNNTGFWNQLISMVKDESEKMMLEFSSKSLSLRLTFRILRVTYGLAKSIIK